METKQPMKRIAVFASGNGSNAENIIRYFRANQCGAEVCLVVTNKAGAGVIERARQCGTEVCVLSPDEIRDPAAMLGVMRRHSVDFIVLAGFLLMIPDFLIDCYRERIVNIHPSLLPKFGGKGMYGRHVHEAVVASGERETGITVHLVSEQCDGGRVLFQASVGVTCDDTPASVEAKVHQLEYEHYPRVIRDFIAAMPDLSQLSAHKVVEC